MSSPVERVTRGMRRAIGPAAALAPVGTPLRATLIVLALAAVGAGEVAQADGGVAHAPLRDQHVVAPQPAGASSTDAVRPGPRQASAPAPIATLRILVLGEAMADPRDPVGSPWPLLRDALVARGVARDVRVDAIGTSRTRIEDWLAPQGYARPRLAAAIAAHRRPGEQPYDYVLWQPGMGDAGRSPMLYERQVMELSNALRHEMRFGRLLMGVGSHCGTTPDDPRIVQAQHQIGDRSMLDIHPGADLQSLPRDAVSEACVLGAPYRAAFARGWADAIVRAHDYGALIDRETLMTPFRALSRGSSAR